MVKKNTIVNADKFDSVLKKILSADTNNDNNTNNNNVNAIDKNVSFDSDIESLEQKLEEKLISEFQTTDSRKKSTNKAEDHYNGHRHRARDRFMKMESHLVSDYDLLELMLFFILARRDVKPIAMKLINKFKNIYGIINSNKLELSGHGVSVESLLFLFKLFREISTRLIRQKLEISAAISNLESLVQYLQLSIGQSKIELFKILFFDTKYHFICDKQFGTGTIDELTVYIRDVVQYTIECNAKYIMISHNHPSGILQPSKEDITLTDRINDVISMINVKLLDHIIISQNGYFSFKEHNLL